MAAKQPLFLVKLFAKQKGWMPPKRSKEELAELRLRALEAARQKKAQMRAAQVPLPVSVPAAHQTVVNAQGSEEPAAEEVEHEAVAVQVKKVAVDESSSDDDDVERTRRMVKRLVKRQLRKQQQRRKKVVDPRSSSSSSEDEEEEEEEEEVPVPKPARRRAAAPRPLAAPFGCRSLPAPPPPQATATKAALSAAVAREELARRVQRDNMRAAWSSVFPGADCPYS